MLLPACPRFWSSLSIALLHIFSASAFCQPFLLEKAITPFDVKGADGQLYSLPFLGGFNVPRPQFIDIDADGDDDLFIQERSDKFLFFEHDAEASGFPFLLRPNAFSHLDMGEWYRFADLDADGDYDLLTEQLFSFVRIYENVGSPQTPQFVLSVDTLKTDLDVPLFAERQNILNVTDIDNDGLLDLFTGNTDGTITHYEQETLASIEALRFSLRSERFQEISIVAELGKTAPPIVGISERHGANTLAFIDIDEDGDNDLFWGDFFERGLLFLQNSGSPQIPLFTTEPALFPEPAPVSSSGYNAPAFGDINRDSRPDLVVGVLGGAFSAFSSSADNLLHYEQNQEGAWTQVSSRFLSNIDAGSDSYPALVDIDADGDVDLVLGNSVDPENSSSARLDVYLNMGSEGFSYETILPVEPGFNYAPAFGDLNNDGHIDMLLGTFQGEMDLYLHAGNEGVPQYNTVLTGVADLASGSSSTPALADMDADGDLDLIVGQSSGILNYFENLGTREDPLFTLSTASYQEIDVGRRSAPFLFDVDQDGDYDLIVGSDLDGLWTYRNVGTAQNAVFSREEWFTVETERRMAPTWGDADGDGDGDLIVGVLEGGLHFYRNITEPLSSEAPERRQEIDVLSYPAPFTESVTLKVVGRHNAHVEIRLYNVLGQEVSTMYKGVSVGESLEVHTLLPGLPAGVYLAVVSIGSQRWHHMLIKR